ncbi:Os03g0213150 [Oryza sativa Japonica Group]|uniref:Os03g0213150 protein n=1 Tax=Oryza sativa subsp. japonica TaxID=39947 RepID=A0A0N7KGT8_ORYSJ|nr:hypothetical protein EE612_016086 [Oryza sativa]BAS82937.1 Os03g0213150 [Oryza sativa Japonica Group]
MTAPSNSAPRPLLIVVGLNAFQMIFSLQRKISIKRNARTQTITFLEKFIQTDDNDASKEKLKYNEDGISSSKLAYTAIHSRQNICHSFPNCNQDTK